VKRKEGWKEKRGEKKESEEEVAKSSDIFQEIARDKFPNHDRKKLFHVILVCSHHVLFWNK